jgi:hypothetical protein
VPGAPDPLEPARDRRRRLDLDDEVDGTHVDAELERAGGHERRQPAGLQRLLDLEPLLSRERAVMRPDEVLAGQFVQALGKPLGEAPAVGEDDRAAVLADQLEDAGVDGRPDAGSLFGAGGGAAACLLEGDRLTQPAHVLDRHDHLQLERLADADVDDRHGSRHAGLRGVRLRWDVAAAEEARDRRERALRRGEADPLRRALRERLEPLEREREVRAALRAGERVDLVDDHPLDAAQRLTRLGGEQQVERFGGRDQDLRRLLAEGAPLVGRRVTGAHADTHLAHLVATPLCREPDPRQRRP